MLALACLAAGCGGNSSTARQSSSPMTKQDWGKGPDGQTVELYTLKNAKGTLQATITNYGAIVTSLQTPDRNGQMADVVLGFDSTDGYLKEHPYFGAVVGRYGNRIAKGRFTLNGKEYQLATNNGPNALHGGIRGFDKRVWTARDVSKEGVPALELTYTSRDKEEGYPGNLTARVTYSVTNNNELRLDYEATTDQDTILNLTNHSYFNLKGQGEGSILDHVIQIQADRFTPVDETLIPTGELKPVAGTPFDFRQPTAIGSRIEHKDEQLIRGKGYDHNFVLNGPQGELSPAARVTEPKSGRVMEVLTTQPGVQFYTGNFLDGKLTGKGGKRYDFRYGFCLETQHFPDSPNKPQFPSVVLKPDATYRSTTVYRFSAE
jgi:aldose 1-epimerase